MVCQLMQVTSAGGTAVCHYFACCGNSLAPYSQLTRWLCCAQPRTRAARRASVQCAPTCTRSLRGMTRA